MPSPSSADRRRDRLVACGLILVSLLVYDANLRVISTGDSLSSRYVPLSVWGWGTTDLDPLSELARDGHADPYWMARSTDGRLVSTYSLVTPLVVTPLYAPAALYLSRVGWRDEAVRGVAKLMEKLAASIVAALGVGLAFVVLRRRVPAWPAFLLTVAYAFGTTTWLVSSQALWQHGVAQILVLLGLLVITRVRDGLRRSDVVKIAVLGSLLALNRPPDAPLALGLGLVALDARRTASTFAILAGAAISTTTYLALSNWWAYGSALGGYEQLGVSAQTFDFPLPEGLVGLLASPGRGLLAYSPFFAFLALRLRRGNDDGFGRSDLWLTVGVALQVLLYANTNVWKNSHVYGPRMLVGAFPILVWMLAPVVPGLRRPGRVLLAATIAFSVLIQTVGAFYFPARLRRFDESVWLPQHYPPILQLGSGPSHFDLPGVTRPLWELEPFEVSLSAVARSVAPAHVLAEIEVTPVGSRRIAWPIAVSIDVVDVEDGAAGRSFGSWLARLPGLDGPAHLAFDLDLATKFVAVTLDGAPAESQGVALGAAPGHAREGRFRATVSIRREDSPRFHPSRPLFDVDAVNGEWLVTPAPPVRQPHVTLRVREGR